MSGKVKDRTGQRCGRLTAIKHVGKDKHGHAIWRCRCDCGNYINVSSVVFSKGSTQKSCGCLNTEVRKSGNNRRVHGGSGTRLYRIWKSMHTRCYNTNSPDYKTYGSISICDEWLHDFNTFRTWALENGYNDTLSIDRIDPTGDYCPDNCRWADDKTQANNRTNNRIIHIGGAEYSIADACKKYNISKALFYKRIREGMSEEDALLTPKKGGEK